jgi:hypothetical protein
MRENHDITQGKQRQLGGFDGVICDRHDAPLSECFTACWRKDRKSKAYAQPKGPNPTPRHEKTRFWPVF